MTKTFSKKKPDALLRTLEKKFGVKHDYKTDAELHASLRKKGVPSLSKLLKLIRTEEDDE